MQIKYLGAEKFEIKTKDTTVSLGYDVQIDNLVFSGPGEYEKSGIFIEGISDNGNTIYVLRMEEMNLCHLGKIAHNLSEDESKLIGDIDILFVPLGEENSLPVKKALELISSVDPKVVIPMLYSDLEEFKKAEGINDNELEILKLKKQDLPVEERKTFVLKA